MVNNVIKDIEKAESALNRAESRLEICDPNIVDDFMQLQLITERLYNNFSKVKDASLDTRFYSIVTNTENYKKDFINNCNYKRYKR